MIVYLDSSAIVPLFLRESASLIVKQYLDDLITDHHGLVTGRITETEVRRTAVRQSVAQTDISALLEGFMIVEHTPSQFRFAGTLGYGNLRSLDAVHIATAIDVGATAMITLDNRMAESCASVGLPCLDIYRPREYAKP